MTEDLTADEQGAIQVAFALCGARGNVSPLLAAVHDIVEARMAKAWDEGFKQGGPMHDENYDDPDAHTRNPYRTTESTDGETVTCAWCGQQHTMTEETP